MLYSYPVQVFFLYKYDQNLFICMTIMQTGIKMIHDAQQSN